LVTTLWLGPGDGIKVVKLEIQLHQKKGEKLSSILHAHKIYFHSAEQNS